MPIIRAKQFVEAYEARARAADIHEMSGRGSRKAQTAFINDRILEAMQVRASDVVLDIGCGDGSLLDAVSQVGATGLGVVPSQEEHHRLTQAYDGRPNLAFRQGFAQALPCDDSFATKIVCNGVLVLLPSEDDVRASLREMARAAKPGGLIWIGEVRERSELPERNYGGSLAGWLLYRLRFAGIRSFVNGCKTLLYAAAGRGDLILDPTTVFLTDPGHLLALAKGCGLENVSWRKHRQLNSAGEEVDSNGRYDFLFRKP